MRTSILATIVVAGSAIAFPATAQQQQTAPSEQTREQMHSDVDKGPKTSEPNEQMQRDADKGVKTRNSGEFRIRRRSRQARRFCPSSGPTGK